MSNKRIDQENAATGLALSNLFETERDPSGGKFHEKLTVQQLMDFVTGYYGLLIPFGTTADLRANTYHLDGHLYIRLGDLVRGDGFSASYYYDDSDSQIDDGSAVIIPNDVTRPATGSYLQINL